MINLAHAFQAYGLYGVDSGDVGGVSQIAIGFLVTVNFICRICSQDFDVSGFDDDSDDEENEEDDGLERAR